jgi:hypothetical protein
MGLSFRISPLTVGEKGILSFINKKTEGLGSVSDDYKTVKPTAEDGCRFFYSRRSG